MHFNWFTFLVHIDRSTGSTKTKTTMPILTPHAALHGDKYTVCYRPSRFDVPRRARTHKFKTISGHILTPNTIWRVGRACTRFTAFVIISIRFVRRHVNSSNWISSKLRPSTKRDGRDDQMVNSTGWAPNSSSKKNRRTIFRFQRFRRVIQSCVICDARPHGQHFITTSSHRAGFLFVFDYFWLIRF